MTEAEEAAAAQAVSLAREVIQKYGADADKPSVKLAIALINGAHERDRLRADGRELLLMLHDISHALNEIGWPSSPMGVRTRACEAIDILGNLNKALRAERDQLLMQIKEMQEHT
jgi:hypothetical protein